jgi:hypothetical protein
VQEGAQQARTLTRERSAMIQAAPTGIPARCTSYCHEILTGQTLAVDDTSVVAAIGFLDPMADVTGWP